MELASKYNPADVEGKWYQYWLDHKLFSSKPDGREPYTIVIPPPNVTGVLHMGHMLNNTIQDILVRRARMEGKNACWVPGTDHASIATELVGWSETFPCGEGGSRSETEEGRYGREWSEKPLAPLKGIEIVAACGVQALNAQLELSAKLTEGFRAECANSACGRGFSCRKAKPLSLGYAEPAPLSGEPSTQLLRTTLSSNAPLPPLRRSPLRIMV